MSEETALSAKIKALQAQNAADEQALKIAELKAQLEAEEEAALLAAQKKKQEEEVNLPKTWEGIPWMEVKVPVWNQFYAEIEKKFDPLLRVDLSAVERKAAELAKKNLGEDYKPLIRKINMDLSILNRFFSLWPKTKAINDATPEIIVRFLLDKIWLQAYGGKVGFSL